MSGENGQAVAQAAKLQAAQQQQLQQQQQQQEINNRVEIKANAAIVAVQSFTTSALQECIKREITETNRANVAEGKNAAYARSFADLGVLLGLVTTHDEAKVEEGAEPVKPFEQKDVVDAFAKVKKSYRGVISQVQPGN